MPIGKKKASRLPKWISKSVRRYPSLPSACWRTCQWPLLGYLKKGKKYKLLFSSEDGKSRGLASHATPAASTTAMHACIAGLQLSPCTPASRFLRADLDWSAQRCTSPADSAAWLPLWGVHDIRCPQVAGGCDCCRGCREGLSWSHPWCTEPRNIPGKHKDTCLRDAGWHHNDPTEARGLVFAVCDLLWLYWRRAPKWK